MHKSALLIIAISLIGCGRLPVAPEVWQCAVKGDPRSFYCVNNKTGERLKASLLDDSFEGAQCLQLSDYNKMQTWIKDLKELAEQRCK